MIQKIPLAKARVKAVRALVQYHLSSPCTGESFASPHERAPRKWPPCLPAQGCRGLAPPSLLYPPQTARLIQQAVGGARSSHWPVAGWGSAQVASRRSHRAIFCIVRSNRPSHHSTPSQAQGCSSGSNNGYAPNKLQMLTGIGSYGINKPDLAVHALGRQHPQSVAVCSQIRILCKRCRSSFAQVPSHRTPLRHRN